MQRLLYCLLALCLLNTGCLTAPRKGNEMVVIDTSMGSMTVELWPDKAPKTVKNFMKYVDSGYYDGLVFHRIIQGFMIQGGGFDLRMVKKETMDPVENEARSDTPNDRGTISMARTPGPHTATSQFFINHKDNPALNHTAKTDQGYGYCVFGKLVDGLEVLDSIAAVETGVMGPYRDIPVKPIVINKIRKAAGAVD